MSYVRSLSRVSKRVSYIHHRYHIFQIKNPYHNLFLDFEVNNSQKSQIKIETKNNKLFMNEFEIKKFDNSDLIFWEPHKSEEEKQM
jgi:hypothetical protein